MDFVRADSSNLPKMDMMMVMDYITTCDKHNRAEIRGAKLLMSSRTSYVDSAVGYVELKRSSYECIVRAKVVPEHKMSAKHYSVTATIDEKEEEIKDVVCDGCPASAGGCKHTFVFLYWLEKRSMEPSSTSVACYWKKPGLSNIKDQPIEATDIFPQSKKIVLPPPDKNILKNFLQECKSRGTHCLASSFFEPKESFNIFDMVLEYLQAFPSKCDFNHLKSHLDTKITPEVNDSINAKTTLQADNVMWHYVRQARITASIIYDAANCSTDGSLVQRILGGYKVPETLAIIRGKKIEAEVIKVAEQQLKAKISKVGFRLINSLVGASPDGLTDDYIVEVKCPFSEKTVKSYVHNGKISKKCAAQMYTQMCAFNKKKGLLIVADPSFEETKVINLIWLDYDEDEMKDLINRSVDFWRKFILGKIEASART